MLSVVGFTRVKRDSSRTMRYAIHMTNPRANATTFAACEFCGRSMKVKAMAYRQKFHAACKRKHDLEVKQAAHAEVVARTLRCALESCGKAFTSKRAHAKYCSPGCRLKAHRA